MSHQIKREFHDNTQKCPCMEGCPGGCPCPDYVCPGGETTTASSTTTETITTTTTTTPAFTNTSILVLNTVYSSNIPLITDSTGKAEYAGTDFSFTYGSNTEAKYSCSITWRGDFFIFGGYSETTQIAKLNGCVLERVGSLAFNHKHGACSNVNDEWIYLCFNDQSGDYKKCRRSNNPLGSFQSIADSEEDHKSAKIGSNKGYRTQLIDFI